MKSPTMKIWSIPVVLAGISVLGLVSALVADGWADTLSWMALAVPVGVILWHACRNRPA